MFRLLELYYVLHGCPSALLIKFITVGRSICPYSMVRTAMQLCEHGQPDEKESDAVAVYLCTTPPLTKKV